MPPVDSLLSKVARPTTTSATNGDAVVTLAAPTDSARYTWFITGLSMSANGTIAAAVAPSLTNIVGPAGTAVTVTWRLPAEAIGPVVIQFGGHPLQVVAGSNAVFTLPALGSGITGTATLYGFIAEL